MSSSIEVNDLPSIRSRAFWIGWALGLPKRTFEAAAWWALVVAVAASVDPPVVLADPAARLRWILIAALATAAILPLPLPR